MIALDGFKLPIRLVFTSLMMGGVVVGMVQFVVNSVAYLLLSRIKMPRFDWKICDDSGDDVASD